MRHLVGADRSYLSVLSGGQVTQIDKSSMDVAQLRAVMTTAAGDWASVLETDPDPDAIVTRHRDDGRLSHAPAGIRLAQAIHHGNHHRTHVCTILRTVDIQPPALDGWAYGAWLRERPERPNYRREPV